MGRTGLKNYISYVQILKIVDSLSFTKKKKRRVVLKFEIVK